MIDATNIPDVPLGFPVPGMCSPHRSSGADDLKEQGTVSALTRHHSRHRALCAGAGAPQGGRGMPVAGTPDVGAEVADPVVIQEAHVVDHGTAKRVLNRPADPHRRLSDHPSGPLSAQTLFPVGAQPGQAWQVPDIASLPPARTGGLA